MPVVTGTRIADRYVVTGEVGAGGMGIVLRARDERLGRAVAIKLLPADAVGDDAGRKRLVREARAAAALDHRGIVHIYDVGETDDGGAFFVMELVRGKSLGDHLRAGTLSRSARLAAIVEVAEALAFAHAEGFVHRDVKPDNVMIRDDGHAVILDFGLAKSVVSALAHTVDAASISVRGAFVGTPAYVSPEQARGEAVDARSDQFALAVVTFEVLTSRLPWEGNSALEVISEILKGEPRRLRDLHPALPASLDAAVSRALAKDPDSRFSDIAAYAAALGEGLGAIAGTPPSAPSASDAARAATISAAVVPTNVSKPRLLRALLGLAAGAALAAGIASYARSPLVPAHATPPALAAPASVLACPQLRARDGELAAAGWLGAAAATLVCDRAQVVLGGAPERTLIPAELLDLPREPQEGFPFDPYEGKDARDKEVTAASERADVWIDGSVGHTNDAFDVALVMRAKNGAELGRGAGSGMILLDAVRAAMDPLLAGPLVRAEDAAYLRTWLPGCSADGALALLDLEVLIIMEDAVGIREQCARLDAHRDLGSLETYARTLCAEKRFQPLPPASLADASSTAALITTASVLRIHPNADEHDKAAQAERARALGAALAAEASPNGRALIAAAQAEVLYHAVGDNDLARQAARASIQASAKLVDVRGVAWHRLAFTSRDASTAVVSAHAAWLPWEPYPQMYVGRARHKDATELVEFSHRAAILARRGFYMNQYGDSLIQVGRLEAARGVAVQTDNDLLRVRIKYAEGRPGEALTLASAALRRMTATMENGSMAPQLASTAIDIAATLGKSTDVVDDFLERFFFAEQASLSKGVLPFFAMIDICAQLPKPKGLRCTKRLGALFESGYFGAAFLGARDALEGLRHHAEGDDLGAAKAWRPLIDKTPGFITASIQGPIVAALLVAKENDLAARLDAQSIAAGEMRPGTSLAYAREALRAEKRGDVAAARMLANEFVDHWDAADERPLAVAAMKQLLARLPK